MTAKRLLSLLLSLVLAVSLSSCTFLFSFLEGMKAGGENESFVPPTYTELTPTAFENTYRDQLSPNEAAVYDAVIALPVGEATVNPTLPENPALCQGRTPTEEEQQALSDLLKRWIANALYAAWLDRPELFWLDFDGFSLEYSLEGDDQNVVKLKKLAITVNRQAGIEDAQATAAALASATSDFAPNGKTLVEKITYINNYLCARIEYDLDAPRRGSMIGALVDGKCVCEGYAQAFSYLCARAGIDAVSIPGYALANGDTEAHLWNAVRLDGVLYAVDVTWNDTTKSNVYLLVGTETECHEGTFGETHTPDSLSESKTQKAFVFPTLSTAAYKTE